MLPVTLSNSPANARSMQAPVLASRQRGKELQGRLHHSSLPQDPGADGSPGGTACAHVGVLSLSLPQCCGPLLSHTGGLCVLSLCTCVNTKFWCSFFIIKKGSFLLKVLVLTG